MVGSFIEDDLAIFFDPGEFGSTAVWTPSGGSAVPDIDGIFDDLQIEIDPYSGVVVSNGGIFFTCAKSDVPGVKQGDQFVIPVKGVDKTMLVKNLPPSSLSEHSIKLELRGP